MLIVTNFASFPTPWKASSGEEGTSVAARSLAEFVRHGMRRDTVLVVNCNPRLVLQLAALFGVGPLPRRPVIAVDLVLRRPAGRLDRLAHGCKRFLFSRVAHFIHYFKDLRAYQEVFGIGPARSSFVPFKVNIVDRYRNEARPEGEYVLCFGRSMRDFDTFFDAVEGLPYPAAIAKPNPAQLRAHGARFTRGLDQLPANVRILDDDGSEASQLRILSDARLIVLPLLKASMVSGISACLNAMLLGKCIIGSEGPGMSDIFPDEVLIVPPEDAPALAAMIRRAWEDEGLRTKIAQAGRRYAVSVGGERELHQRIIDEVVRWRQARGKG